MLILNSCDKSQIEKTVISNDIQSFAIPDYCNEMNNGNSNFHGLLNSEDVEDEKINTCLFFTALSYAKLMNNSTYLTHVTSKSNFDGNNELKVKDMSTITGFMNDLDAEINTSSHCLSNPYSDYQDLENDMVYVGDDYYPVLYFLNAAEATSTSRIIICVASEINDEDGIPGWKIEPTQVSEIVIYESDTSDTIPILIIANGTDSVGGSNDNDTGTYEMGTRGGRQIEYLTIDNHKINHKFERDAYSEYAYVKWARFTTSDGAVGQDYKTINSIFRTSVGVTQNGDINYTSGSSATLKGEWVASYERDWNNSKKNIRVPAQNGAPHSKNMTNVARRKYAGEYYQRGFINFANGSNSMTVNSRGSLNVDY